MPKLARDVMQPHVISVNQDACLLDVHRLFVEEEVGGAPVVDEDGTLLGVISSSDLLRTVTEEHEAASGHSVYFRNDFEFSGPDWLSAPDDLQDRLGQMRVSDSMTKGAVTVSPDSTIHEVATTLRGNRIHRVLVVKNGVLEGIVSTFDLLGLLEREV